MIIELEVNGARLIVSGDNLTVNVSGPDPKPAPAQRPVVGYQGCDLGIASLQEWLSEVRGRATALADELGITRSAIPQWREVPADKLIAVERVTGIKRQVLRPDLFEGMSR